MPLTGETRVLFGTGDKISCTFQMTFTGANFVVGKCEHENFASGHVKTINLIPSWNSGETLDTFTTHSQP